MSNQFAMSCIVPEFQLLEMTSLHVTRQLEAFERHGECQCLSQEVTVSLHYGKVEC